MGNWQWFKHRYYRIIHLIVLLLILACHVRAGDIIVGARGPTWIVAQNQTWSTLNNAYMISPIGPTGQICVSIVNNNPNTLALSISIWFTGFPTSTPLFGSSPASGVPGTAIWTATSIQASAQSISGNGANNGICTSYTGAAWLALTIFNATASTTATASVIAMESDGLSSTSSSSTTVVTPLQPAPSFNAVATSGSNAAVSATITGVSGTTIFVYGVTARCSAGSSQFTVSDAATVIYNEQTGFVGTGNQSVTWPVPLRITTGNTLTITLATCGSGNVGTLITQVSQF